MVESVVVRCRFHGDGSYSAVVLSGGKLVAYTGCGTGRMMAGWVAAALTELSQRWAHPIQAVYDLGGSRPAFLAVAQVEGFLDAVCEHQLDPTLSA